MSWLKFEETPNRLGLKTRCWRVVNTNDEWLGDIRWRPAWRQYVFNSDLGVFSHSCLTDLAKFCREQTEAQRANCYKRSAKA
jgi:hypothetical protein